jgi:hypothetical protein
MRLAIFAVAAFVGSTACGNENHPEYHPQTAYSVNQTLMYGTTIFQAGGAAPAVVSSAPPVPDTAPAATATVDPPPPTGDPSHVIAIESPRLDRPAEVIGVVDVASSGSHDEALVALKARAAGLGADAVVGVEFHDSDSAGRPNHVSGLAVRFTGTHRSGD